MTILTGQSLAVALSKARDSIALRDFSTRHKIGEVNGEQVVMLLATGRVEAIGRGKRLRYLRALDPSIIVPRVRGMRESCWLSTQAAVDWRYSNDTASGIPA